MWEILVPTMRSSGVPIKTRFHKVWDEKVRAITGGLTILAVSKGQWINKSGKLFIERMIPVRIAATREQIQNIMKMTLKYYEQEAILAYKISTEVIFLHREEERVK